MDSLRFSFIFVDQAFKIVEKIENNAFYFLPLYPFISAFQALSCLSNGRSWRNVSIDITISSFGALWLDVRKLANIEILSKFYRNAIEIPSDIKKNVKTTPWWDRKAKMLKKLWFPQFGLKGQERHNEFAPYFFFLIFISV